MEKLFLIWFGVFELIHPPQNEFDDPLNKQTVVFIECLFKQR